MKRRVAVIDDSEIILEATKEALTDAGFDVVALTEPSRQALAGPPPVELIVLDVQLPQAFGDDIAQFLRDRWGVTAPIVLYSSLSEEELKVRATAAGAVGYVCKDWGLERLVEDLQRRTSRTSSVSERPANAPAATAGLFERFVKRCKEREAWLMAELDASNAEDGASIVRRFNPKIHDWIGESKLLGFERLAGVATRLKEAMAMWGETFRVATQGAQLRIWIRRLTNVSSQLALAAPSRDALDELQALRVEIEEELSLTEPQHLPDRTQTGELVSVKDTRRILLFDDSPIVREVLTLELEARGHSVAQAETWQQFQELLGDFDPEIIFLDINLPEVKGDEVCRRVKSGIHTRSIPVIFLSSLPDESLEQLAQKSGADGYLSKQRGMDDLIRYLDDILVQVVF